MATWMPTLLQSAVCKSPKHVLGIPAVGPPVVHFVAPNQPTAGAPRSEPNRRRLSGMTSARHAGHSSSSPSHP